MSSKQHSSVFIDRSTTQSYSDANHGRGNIHQSHYRNRSNQNFHQRNNNFNNRRQYQYHNRQTNGSYNHNKQPSLQQSMDCTSYDNYDYLNRNQVLKWFTGKSISAKFMIQDYVTYAYVTVLTSIYDKWIRDDCKLKLWKAYLKLDEEYDYWAAEVLQSTQELDNDTNIEFIHEKIRELNDNISFIIDDYRECGRIFEHYRKNNSSEQIAKHLFELSGIISTTGAAFPENNVHDSIIQLETYAHGYVIHCTRHL
ncbi:unnamed protein product [Didymodactylos carnosus]|uniref:Uncharacterized protein n=1 Tax=Didymodactylos carnosus TaxID=1234261 RepID=A0A815ZKH3_9BILA|nr:unnamed protein product [Didymodactylos carnosus]CAF1583608.1 unnamed protein product [Didymodactylos carnosus]CAF4315615.1 unnamed protein product [Didymodactylos carnosus]CAF4451989.1 unnamed protein product [Didymodactylos carnosus]